MALPFHMEQTTVNQYFQARKSSSIQASKRRKVELPVTENKSISTHAKKLQSVPEKRNLKASQRPRKRKTRGKQDNESSLTISAILKSTPLNFDESISSVSETDHSTKLKRKQAIPVTPKKSLQNNNLAASPFKAASPKLSREAFHDPDIPVNSSINEQAKLVLFSRGNTLLQAGLSPKKVKSPLKASEVLERLSPKRRLLPPSSSDLNKDNEKTSLIQRKARLRAKFSNLLKEDNTRENIQNESIQENKFPNAEEILKRPSRVRACDKYKHLTEVKPIPSTFELPDHYKLLLEMFRCTDSVLFLLNQRSETCTYDKLKKSVQSMCGREFSIKHLAMMKTAYPTGFVFRQEKGLHSSDGLNAKNMSSYQLTIEANFKDALVSPSSKLASNVLITRKLKFENCLLSIVRQHHDRFLRKLNINLDGKKIHRWHPRFKLNDIPEVEQANMPKPPITKSFSTASDILIKSCGLLCPQVEKALESASNKSSTENTPSAPNQSTSESKPPVCQSTSTNNNKQKNNNDSNSKTKSNLNAGPPKSLIERIREKEQKKMQRAMTRDPKVEERLSQMARLPEMSRILNTYFISEKKVALPMEDCVIKLTESYGSALQINKLESHIRLISELVPTWLSVMLVRKCPYVKLARNSDINKVLKTLEIRKIEEEEK